MRAMRADFQALQIVSMASAAGASAEAAGARARQRDASTSQAALSSFQHMRPAFPPRLPAAASVPVCAAAGRRRQQAAAHRLLPDIDEARRQTRLTICCDILPPH